MFEEIVGNQSIKERLKKSLSDGTHSHAYLFYGPKGTQKTDMALAFAQGILCTDLHNKPCGQCSSCKKVARGNHPDLHMIQPAEDKEAIGIDQIRKMQRNIAVKPYEGDRKVYILKRTETMKDAAQNSMLKILEEPEEGAVLILIANSRSSILPTILSRCQQMSFSPLTYEAFSEEWRKRFGEDRDLEFMYNLTQGKFGEALRIAAEPGEGEDFRMLSSAMDKAIRGDWDQIFRITARAEKRRMDGLVLTDHLLIYFRNKMLEKSAGNHQDGTDCLTIEKIHDIIEKILQFQSNMHINLNTGLQVENLLLHIQEDSNDRGRRNTF